MLWFLTTLSKQKSHIWGQKWVKYCFYWNPPWLLLKWSWNEDYLPLRVLIIFFFPTEIYFSVACWPDHLGDKVPRILPLDLLCSCLHHRILLGEGRGRSGYRHSSLPRGSWCSSQGTTQSPPHQSWRSASWCTCCCPAPPSNTAPTRIWGREVFVK